MKIKFSPQRSERTTRFFCICADMIRIDDEEYQFDDGIDWPEISEQTGGAIMEAHRDEAGELHITVLYQYAADQTSVWGNPNYYPEGGYRGSRYESEEETCS
jgi:hypothetical protein